MSKFLSMVKGLVMLAVVIGAGLTTGCATYNSGLKPSESEFRNIVKDGSMNVYIKPSEFENCLWGLGKRENGCVKGEISTLLTPSLKAEGITVVNNQQDANVVIELIDVSAARGWDYFPTTTKFNINGATVKIIARPYIETLSVFATADKRDWDAGLKTTVMVITKLLKHNKICDCEIIAKTKYSKADGNIIIEYRDNTGF